MSGMGTVPFGANMTTFEITTCRKSTFVAATLGSSYLTISMELVDSID